MVRLKVQERFYGVPDDVDIIELPYSTEMRAKKYIENPGYPWLKISLSKDSLITAVVPMERVRQFGPGMPAFLTNSERESEAIRALAEQCVRLEQSPSAIPETTWTRSALPEAMLAGFIFEYAHMLPSFIPGIGGRVH
jgi:hypothetical protein